MTGTVLVPYDGSEQSENALSYAFGAFPEYAIAVLHVVTPRGGHGAADGYTAGYEQAIAAGETVVEAARESAPDGREVHTDVVYGRPIGGILESLEDGAFEHVVMGSHGRDGAARLLLGSVAETVVRRAPVPVTVVRGGEDATTSPGKILVPFDGSELSEAALEHALERYPQAAVTALYVVYPPRELTQSETATPLEEWDGEDRVRETLTTAEDIGAEAGRDIDTVTVEGLPEDRIVAVIDEEGFDHVVMGSSGREGIGRLLLGSVAETVVRRSPVSVTVTR